MVRPPNRDDALGCFFVIPRKLNGWAEEQRGAVVRAEEMLLDAIAAGGGQAAEGEVQRIASGGPSGGGWRIPGHNKPVALVTAGDLVRADPTGAHKWTRMQQLAAGVERGEDRGEEGEDEDAF